MPVPRIPGFWRKIGNVARRNVGVADGQVPLMDATGYPAADGSQITALTYGNITNATGKVLQVVQTQDGAVATGTTILPSDDTIPQITEGDEYMTLAITPKSATSRLRLDIKFNAAPSAGNIVLALFRDAIAGALAVTEMRAATVNFLYSIPLLHDMPSPGLPATTFRVRAGLNVAGTLTFNGVAGARKFGGVIDSGIVITEYMP